MRLAVPVEKLPHRGPHNRDTALLPQPLDHLVKGRVRRLCKHAQNEIRSRATGRNTRKGACNRGHAPDFYCLSRTPGPPPFFATN
jgi:hypothetical protein